jgi:glycine/D-amino acid oxidase-like deaminating enzyme
VIRTVVGLRPYRPSGFRVEAERMDDKLVVHDYGHGGAGITLSWGTAEQAVVEAMHAEDRSAAVLGCGAVGLATARLLQRRGWQVTIYARDLPPRTTSNVAGGLWAPTSVAEASNMTGDFGRAFRDASRLAHRHFQDVPRARFGIRWLDSYVFGDRPVSRPSWIEEIAELYPGLESLSPGEHPFGDRHALRFLTMVIEPHIYLREMLHEVRRAGGDVVVRELRGMDDVMSLPEHVIMNCTGLGARALFGDEELVPVKGQLHVLVPQDDVDYVTLAGGLYMIPRSDGILLGGTFERGNWSLEPDPDAQRRIVDGHGEFFRAMAG